MKKFLRLLGIAALMAAVFGFLACSDDGGSSGGGVPTVPPTVTENPAEALAEKLQTMETTLANVDIEAFTKETLDEFLTTNRGKYDIVVSAKNSEYFEEAIKSCPKLKALIAKIEELGAAPAKTKYDEIVEAGEADGMILVKENFAITTELEKFSGEFGTPGVYVSSEFSNIGTEVGNKVTYEIKDGKATFGKGSSTNALAVIDFGLVKNVVEGYFEFEMKDSSSGNYNNINFYSTASNCVLQIMANGTNFKYTLNGSVVSPSGTIEAAKDTLYKVYYKFDLANKKLDLIINDTNVFENFDSDIASVSGVTINTSNSGQRQNVVDNIAVYGTEMTNAGDYKATAKSVLATACAKKVTVDNTDPANPAYSTTNYKINLETLKTAYDAGVSAIEAVADTETIDAMKAKLAEVLETLDAVKDDDTVIGEYIAEKVTEITDHKATEIEAIDDADAKAAVEGVKAAEIAKITVAAVKDENDNYATNYQAKVDEMVAAAKTAIDDSYSKNTVSAEVAKTAAQEDYTSYKTTKLATVQDATFKATLGIDETAPALDFADCDTAAKVNAELEAKKAAYDEWLAGKIAAKTYTITIGSETLSVGYGKTLNVAAVDPCGENEMVKDGKFYTDNACTEEYTPAAVYGDFELYYQTETAIKVTSKSEFSWAAITGITTDQQKLTQADMTGVNAFIIPEDCLQWRKSDADSVSKMVQGFANDDLEHKAFSVVFLGTGTLKVGVRGGGNSTDTTFYLADEDGTKVTATWATPDTNNSASITETEKVYTMHSKAYEAFTFAIQAPGKYTMYVVKKTCRFGSIEKVDNYKGVPIALTGISLDKTNETIKEGESLTLAVTLDPVDANTVKSTEWSSSDENVATVDDKGVVTAKGAGSATITVKVTDVNDAEKTATCTITVQEVTVVAGTYNLKTGTGNLFPTKNTVGTTVSNRGITLTCATDSNGAILKISNSAQQGTVKFKIAKTMTLVATDTANKGIGIVTTDGKATYDNSGTATEIQMDAAPTAKLTDKTTLKLADANISGKTLTLTAGTYEICALTDGSAKIAELTFAEVSD